MLDVPTSRKDCAAWISILAGLGAIAAVAFGDLTLRSFVAAGMFAAAVVLSIVAVRPRRAIGIPMTAVSVPLALGAVYVLIAPQVG